MSKCGIVMRDPVTEEYKVKLYKDKEGNLKGDGLCCYLKVSRSRCSSLQSLLYVDGQLFVSLKKTFLGMITKLRIASAVIMYCFGGHNKLDLGPNLAPWPEFDRYVPKQRLDIWTSPATTIGVGEVQLSYLDNVIVFQISPPCILKRTPVSDCVLHVNAVSFCHFLTDIQHLKNVTHTRRWHHIK